MTPKDFCYWLQGFSELHQHAPTQEQWGSIREHLQLVFTKVTAPIGGDDKRSDDKAVSDEVQKIVNEMNRKHLQPAPCQQDPLIWLPP